MLTLRLLKESLIISARLWRCLKLWMKVPILHLNGIIEPWIRHSSCEASSTISCECDMNGVELEEVSQVQDHPNPERWAVNLNQYACESLKLNHPEIEVRNESAEDFLLLLEKWEKSCYYFSLIKSNDVLQEYANLFGTENVADDGSGDDNDSDEGDGEDEEVFEVETELKRKKHEKVFANLEPEVKVPVNQDQNHVVEPQTTLEEAVELLRRLMEEVRKNQLANYKSNGEEFKDADADRNNNFENLFGNFREEQAPIQDDKAGSAGMALVINIAKALLKHKFNFSF
ncbi:hypothetical protein CMV_001495 [Castanea mollissima]|uniref:Uncharacterized protein n=1 Tax=Castanea mollissima TaxID=60419 RepID=A0A8J4RKS7_9ROSI|nr:hypothetical protein CMV_001495 [Castanea mollissima]